MPTYTFQCPTCQEERSLVQSIHAGPPAEVRCEQGHPMTRTYRIDSHVPRMAFKPWDVMYHTKIEPRWRQWKAKHAARQRATRPGG